jgi:hypothetical protein
MTRVTAGVVLALSFLIGIAQPCAAETRRVLLSIDGVATPHGKTIFAYRIETFGVEFLATCRLPQSWELKSEKFENPAGYLAGRGDLHGEPLTALKNLYLVDVHDYRPRTWQAAGSEQPASFSGWVEVGSREAFGAWHGRKIKLRAENFRLTDAKNCPVPPAPQP